MESQLLLLILFISGAVGVPMSQKCPETETLRLNRYDLLELKCGSPCGASNSDGYKWTKSSRELSEVELDFHGPTFTIQSVDYEDQGSYQCRCLPNGPQCEQAVHIIPTMEFSSVAKHVYTGDPVELVCTVHSPQPKPPVIKLKSGKDLPSYDLKETLLDEHSYKTEAWLYDQTELKVDYVCVMEGSEENEAIEKQLSIYSYDPPEILYTTEFNVAPGSNMGQSGKLVCSVLTSRHTESRVTWLFEGKEVQLDTGKFSTRIQHSSKKKDVVDYMLLIDDIQEEDIGAYVCQLHSDFSEIEDEHEAWIRLKESADNTNSIIQEAMPRRNVIYLIGVVGVVTGVWCVWCKCRASRKKKLESSGLLGNGSSFTHDSMGLGWTNTTRRKQI